MCESMENLSRIVPVYLSAYRRETEKKLSYIYAYIYAYITYCY